MTTNATHTPGPWTARELYDPRTGTHIYIDAPATGTVTATVAEVLEDYDTMRDGAPEANARLIAAAPELLETLGGLAQAIQDGRQWGRVPEIVEAWLKKAYAAIAKVEGVNSFGTVGGCELHNKVDCARCGKVRS